MEIKLNFFKPFTDCLLKLKIKYDFRFEMMNGLSNSNLNFTDFINNFIESATVAETTIDANANSTTHDVRTLLSDMVKPHTKLLSYNKIFEDLTKKYGQETAEKWLEGEWNGSFYLHNSATSSFTPYCYAYDLEKLVNNGLYFINKFKTGAPKHLTTFNDHVL